MVRPILTYLFNLCPKLEGEMKTYSTFELKLCFNQGDIGNIILHGSVLSSILIGALNMLVIPHVEQYIYLALEIAHEIIVR